MFDAITDFFLSKPQRITIAGGLLFRIGAALAFFALVGRLATVGISAIASMGGTAAPARSLADVYPALPTWFVPESVPGYFGALLLLAAGTALVVTGKRVERWMNS